MQNNVAAKDLRWVREMKAENNNARKFSRSRLGINETHKELAIMLSVDVPFTAQCRSIVWALVA